jgi:hypothetical protein
LNQPPLWQNDQARLTPRLVVFYLLGGALAKGMVSLP